MDGIDSKILVITRNKNKIKPIRRILADSSNFEYESTENYWKINSTSSDRQYKVFKTDKNYYCDCVFNTQYIPYREGQKKKGRKPECIHVLALRTFLAITKP